MYHFLISLFVLFFSAASFAGDEIIFDIESQRGVVDRYTDSTLELWEQKSSLFEICYKNADAQQALNEILILKNQGILFNFETEDFIDAGVVGEIVRITVFNGKMLDNGIDPNDAKQTFEIAPCSF